MLDRRCPDCGFDASTCAADGRPDADEGEREHLGRCSPREHSAGTTEASSWSSLEYACHVRDVFLRYDQRIALMQAEDDPLFPNWDQDASAIDDGYEAQDPTQVVGDLSRRPSSCRAIRADLRRRVEPPWPSRRRRVVHDRDDRALHDPRPDPSRLGRDSATRALNGVRYSLMSWLRRNRGWSPRCAVGAACRSSGCMRITSPAVAVFSTTRSGMPWTASSRSWKRGLARRRRHRCRGRGGTERLA